jgi:sulfite reductase alpha subunit-like flavoprotein
MIAVGVGIAPMIHAMRAVFKERRRSLLEATQKGIASEDVVPDLKIKLLYGAVCFNHDFSLKSLLCRIAPLMSLFVRY